MHKCFKVCDSIKVEKYRLGGYRVPTSTSYVFRSHPIFIVPKVGGMAVQLVVTVHSKTLENFLKRQWVKGQSGLQTSSHISGMLWKEKQPGSVRQVPVRRSRVNLHRCYVPNHCLSTLSVLHQADHKHSIYLTLPVSTLGWVSRSSIEKVLKSPCNVQK